MPANDSPLSWNEIKEKIANKDYKFERTAESLGQYSSHMRSLHEEWYAVDDYCKHNILKFPFTVGVRTRNTRYQQDTKELKYVEEDATTEGPSIVICKNDFPYSFSPEIQHFLVWSVNELKIEEYEAHVVKQYSREEYDMMMFINPPALQSVKGIHHAHLLLRKKQEKSAQP